MRGKRNALLPLAQQVARGARARTRRSAARASGSGRSAPRASVSWKVWPTTIVSIAPFASGEISVGSRATSAEPKRFATFAAAARAPRTTGVEVDLRPEVVEARRVRRQPVRRRQDLVAAVAELVARASTRSPVTPFPLRTVTVVSRAAGAATSSFRPSATAVAFSDDSTSGWVNFWTARGDVRASPWSGRRSPRAPRSASGRRGRAEARRRRARTRGPSSRRRPCRRPAPPRRCS